MRYYGRLLTLLILFLVPFSAFSAEVPAFSNASQQNALSFTPVRDDSDEDSIIYLFDFEGEEGWDQWTQSLGDFWHTSETNAYEDGSSWWCGVEEHAGYVDHMLQFLMTPEIDLVEANDATLTFKLFYACEDPENGAPDPNDWPGYDAWDGCNVWISIGDDEWEVLTPTTPDYNYESLFSFGWEWNMGEDIPGWCGFSNGWLDAEFDLTDYVGNTVQIRWAFSADPAWNTDDDENAIGYLVDEMVVTADDNEVWANDGTEQGDMEFGDIPFKWVQTDEDAYESEFSAHCPMGSLVTGHLITEPIAIPSSESYTYFDFRVRCDARISDSNGDGSLDDLFSVYLSDDGYSWTRMFYDYASDEEGQEHHPEWFEEFGLYEPGTFFRRDDIWGQEEWRWKMNLTPFAEDTIRLMWMFETDDFTDGDQGTGLYIDDVRIQISSRVANDVGVNWLNIPHPISIGYPTRCGIKISNFGITDQGRVTKYYQIDGNEPIHIGNPGGIAADSSVESTFFLVAIPYADTVVIRSYTDLEDDQDTTNDEMTVENVVIYPPGILSLGYDSWNPRFSFDHDQGAGAAVLFTPRADGYRRDYDLEAIRVRWNGLGEDVDVRMHIYEYNNDIRDEIYNEVITVTPSQSFPEIMVVDLSEVDQLQGIDGDFLVWFEMLRDDFLPQIIRDRPDLPLSSGHYFTYDGDGNLEEDDADQWAVHAIIMAENTDKTELTAGRFELNFDYVQPEEEATMRVAMFNGGTHPVTIEALDVDNDAFSAEAMFDMPHTLRIGDMAHIYVTFAPTDVEYYAGELSFTTNDETPPTIRLRGSGDLAVGDSELTTPNSFSLGAAFPNPFNATTAIPFALPYAAEIKLAVYDLSGRMVAEVASGKRDAGRHLAEFDASDLSSGVYIYRLETADFSAGSKIVLVK